MTHQQRVAAESETYRRQALARRALREERIAMLRLIASDAAPLDHLFRAAEHVVLWTDDHGCARHATREYI